MLDKDQINAASRVLVRHWRDGSKLDALETRLRPQSRADGYAVQAELENRSFGKLFGWKIAATSEAGQKHINVTGPLAGRIMSDTVIADGGIASMKGNAMRVGEPEFCFRMGRELAPRPSPFGVDEVLAAVDSLHPAIEIPDSRFADFAGAGEAQLIADNACAHLFVLGAATPANWRAMDLVEERPQITLRGERYVGHGKNGLGGPADSADLACQRAARARHHLAGRGGGDDGNLSSAAADPGRRSFCGGFRYAGESVGGV